MLKLSVDLSFTPLMASTPFVDLELDASVADQRLLSKHVGSSIAQSNLGNFTTSPFPALAHRPSSSTRGPARALAMSQCADDDVKPVFHVSAESKKFMATSHVVFRFD